MDSQHYIITLPESDGDAEWRAIKNTWIEERRMLDDYLKVRRFEHEELLMSVYFECGACLNSLEAQHIGAIVDQDEDTDAERITLLTSCPHCDAHVWVYLHVVLEQAPAGAPFIPFQPQGCFDLVARLRNARLRDGETRQDMERPLATRIKSHFKRARAWGIAAIIFGVGGFLFPALYPAIMVTAWMGGEVLFLWVSGLPSEKPTRQ